MAITPLNVIQAAQAAERAYYPKGPFVSCILAQWADESAYGTQVSGVNNFFGIKATAAQIAAGQATKRWTHETINGVYGPYALYFANYPSPTECFMAHSALLCDPKMAWAYADCWAAQTPEAYCHALSEHYATGNPNEPSYGDVLIAIINDNGYKQYDIIRSAA